MKTTPILIHCHFRLRREHEKMLKQKAKASEQATKMALPKPVGSIPDPEYLKPGFLATPPPNLGMHGVVKFIMLAKDHNSQFGIRIIIDFQIFFFPRLPWCSARCCP